MCWAQSYGAPVVGEGSLRVATEFGGQYLNRCRSRTVLTDTHLDGDTRLGNLRTELVDLETEYVKPTHHLSIMRMDPVRASYARHHTYRRIGY